MPIAYYGSKISPHMVMSQEGYLICYDVPINRIGAQKYLAREMEMDGDSEYEVIRRPEEVFSPEAMASFEGKPVTDGHPSEDVTADNIQLYEKGHAQNIRKGTGPNAGMTIADLFITDPQLIDEIQNGGKREISCGYNYALFPHENGTFEQRNIRGNHIAVVPKGRAGHRVSIKDEKPLERGTKMNEEKKKGNWFGRLLKVAAKDEDMSPDDLEKISKMGSKPDEESPKEEPKEPPVEEPQEEAKDDEESSTDALLKEAIDLLKDVKAALAPKESEDELEDIINPNNEDPELNPEKEEEDESPEEEEPSVTAPAEEITGKTCARDAAKAAASVVQTTLRNTIKDPKAYKMAAKDAAAEIRRQYGIPRDNSGYSAFVRTTSKAAKNRSAHDSAVLNEQQKAFETVQNDYDNMNPHHKEVK